MMEGVSRPGVMIFGGLAAGAAWALATTCLPHGPANTFPFIASWITLYPFTRFSSERPMPSLQYWLTGAFIAVFGATIRTLLYF